MLSKQLQVFLYVAECGSFTGAAKKLLVTPASVMKHMNTLESKLGVTLFMRDKRGIQLTDAGKILYTKGEKLRSDAEKILSDVKKNC